jgi:NAD(P)-dependent dehydrogenase (short-subunit alcohol dehydrogenase family)
LRLIIYTISGIGLETSILFLREGANVIMTDISEPALEKAIAKAKELVPHAPGKVQTAKVDVSKEADIEAVVAQLDAWGGLDIMFNNAGIMHADDAGEQPPRISLTKHLLTRDSQMPSTPPRKSGT